MPVDDVGGAVFRGKRGPYTARGIEYMVSELGRPLTSRMCTRIDFATTQRGASSSRSTCPPWRRGWATRGWTRCGSTVSGRSCSRTGGSSTRSPVKPPVGIRKQRSFHTGGQSPVWLHLAASQMGGRPLDTAARIGQAACGHRYIRVRAWARLAPNVSSHGRLFGDVYSGTFIRDE